MTAIQKFEQLEVQPGLSLHVASWRPDAPRAVVVLAHGYAEHLGRYDHVADALTAAGFSTWAMDHEGHGRSDGTRMLIRDFAVSGRAVDRVADRAAACDPGLPMFLVGHSMGSMIATEAALFNPARWTGLVLSGSPLDAASTMSATQVKILSALAKVGPGLRMGPPLKAETICSVPEVVEAYLADPLVDNGKMPLGTAAAVLGCSKVHPGEVGALKMPVLLLHGEQDELTPIAGSDLLLSSLGPGDRILKRYPGRHEVFNESFRDEVLSDLVGWIDDHMPSESSDSE